MIPQVNWPDNKRFAFSIFDDTDLATIENVAPVYSFLLKCGIKPTKSVWVLPGTSKGINKGATCNEADHLAWLLHLQQSGVEIASHMATYHTSYREETAIALNKFKEHFGNYPRSYASHTGCQEALYWGDARVTGVNRLLYNLLTKFKAAGLYMGHVEKSPYFWGDLAKKHISYVRNFTFPEINTLKACPFMPYHDPKRPYANFWFASTDGNVLETFNHCLKEDNQDRLEAEGGACIMYTHFASGFYKNKVLDKTFVRLMERIAAKNGWFVPVSELLDYLLAQKKVMTISAMQRFFLEARWLKFKISVRGTT